MFRMRRYRVFIVFAVITIGVLHHFTNIANLESAGAASVEGLKNLGQKVESSSPPPASEPQGKDTTNKKDVDAPITVTSLADSETPKSTAPIVRESEVLPTPTSLTKAPVKESVEDAENESPVKIPVKESVEDAEDESPVQTPVKEGAWDAEDESTRNHRFPSLAKTTAAVGSESANKTTKPHSGPADPIINPGGGEGRLEIIAETGIPKIHWSQQPEHFPVPTENIIQLPTGKPKAIPNIQHVFKAESADDKAAREEKQDKIRKVFLFSWAGYKKKAWSQDELSPISGRYRNPFNGWGATLVDSLDTLWMMGLKDEFEEAVEAVRAIDFTTSARNDIPLFETVIRYLGGLVAAYDISDGAHRIILDKAVELADILMGAFDTPNRMPMTFYLWKPTFASQPHRAKTRVVLAELGSLSVEFTRLAQITKEAKYYDAVARITNELDIWQNNTKMPGLWPQQVDASGCKKPDMNTQSNYDYTASYEAPESQSPTLMDGGPAKTAAIAKNVTAGTNVGARSPTSPAKDAIKKRQVEVVDEPNQKSTPKPPGCEPQGLASPPFTVSEDFGIGGQADSTYEYLPKEYILLGGLEEKYRTMYEAVAETTAKKLLFRPMIHDEKRHVLHAGHARVDNQDSPVRLTPEGTHLTCFVGGMYALGAKVFSREDDMDIAKKLTDGCVWAYESTATGIMPESYLVVPCPDPIDCPWNETLYHEKLDPYAHVREQQRLQQQESVLENEKKVALQESQEKAAQAEPVKSTSTGESIDSQPGDSEATANDSQTSEQKADQAIGKPVEDKVVGPEQEKADKAVSKPTEGTSTKPDSDVSEEDAEISSLKPVEGAAPPKPLVKRQLGDVGESGESFFAANPEAQATEVAMVAGNGPVFEKSTTEQHLETQGLLPNKANQGLLPTHANGTSKPEVYTPPPIPTHEEFAKARIQDERLPEGMTKVTGARYILRPEAIESVFIMYRATGDIYWREKGWEMFKAVEKHTNGTYGAGAISDVTSEKPSVLDEMESFWLAETLKYFYLLFADPSQVSLDDYVLNTEAHAFKRPK